VRPMLAAQKYRGPGDLWSPEHEAVVQKHLDADGYLIVQPKWDGFRGVLDSNSGQVMSRSWKPLANPHLQSWAAEAVARYPFLAFVDGETFPGHDYHPELFRQCMSDLRSSSGTNKLMWVLYDYPRFPNLSYEARRHTLIERVFQGEVNRTIEAGGAEMLLQLCPQIEVRSLEELYAEEARLLALNFEGAIVRRPHAPYKNNRATAVGGELVKVKRRITIDAKVVGYAERLSNQNEAFIDERGYTKRPSIQAGKVATGLLGSLSLELLDGSNSKCDCGVFRGLSHPDLRTLWEERESLPGRYCEVSVDPITGGYDTARTPVWLRWRDASEF
jgi:ATP-dependent DNA ligase